MHISKPKRGGRGGRGRGGRGADGDRAEGNDDIAVAEDGYKKKSKAAKKPAAKKFSEIMKNDTNAFPAREGEDDDEEEPTPAGEDN